MNKTANIKGRSRYIFATVLTHCHVPVSLITDKKVEKDQNACTLLSS